MESTEEKRIKFTNDVEEISREYTDLQGQMEFIDKEMANYKFDYEIDAAKDAFESLRVKVSELHKRLCILIIEIEHLYDNENECKELDAQLRGILDMDFHLCSDTDKLYGKINILMNELSTKITDASAN